VQATPGLLSVLPGTVHPMTTIDQLTWRELPVTGPFDLSASAQFLEGFAPAARKDAVAEPGVLKLAFPVAPSWRPAGVLVRQPVRGGPVRVAVRADPPDVEHAIATVRRVLSIDIPGEGFTEIGARDPVVGELQARYPGLRPVAFYSPYEAACYAIISHRVRMTQAATIKHQLAVRLGDQVDIHGTTLPTFPAPAVLKAQPHIPMVSELKSNRLKAIAEAAEAGHLDAETLRAMPTKEALTRLQELPGIGAFSAELILLRGAAHPDGFPEAETRLHEEMRRAYHAATSQDLKEIAETWSPYRTWVSLLLRVRREEETQEIATGHRATR
jgi:3-methyladenine DNA glycosylase/8-oxoguanine DNA glycosylase